jgi:hypothetical protein
MKALLPAVAALATLFAAPAFAQTYAAVGYTHNSMSEDIIDTDFGAISGVVGMHFSDHFGGELQGSIGTSDGDMTYLGVPFTVSVDYELGAFGVAYLPLGDKAELYGRLGVTTAQGTVEAPTISYSEDVSGSGVAGGVGIQAFFTDHLGVRADYTRSDNLGSNQFSIQAAFRF